MAVREFIREFSGQVAGTASQVDDLEIRPDIHERNQVIKWCGSLGLKLVIEIWVPGH
jgi:hypothetical protein